MREVALVVSNGSGTGDGRRQAVARYCDASLDGFARDALDDHFSGSVVSNLPDDPSSLGETSPVLDVASDLLAPDRGFLAVLSSAFEADLQPNRSNLLLIQGMWSSTGFMNDRRYRRATLEHVCAREMSSPGFALIHPPTTFWSARDHNARFRLNRLRDKNLELCVLFGAIGFAQMCDDRLQHPIPLLVQPWSPESGLLRPIKLPTKSFSQILRVARVADRRLVLFDKHCLDGMAGDR